MSGALIPAAHVTLVAVALNDVVAALTVAYDILNTRTRETIAEGRQPTLVTQAVAEEPLTQTGSVVTTMTPPMAAQLGGSSRLAFAVRGTLPLLEAGRNTLTRTVQTAEGPRDLGAVRVA